MNIRRSPHQNYGMTLPEVLIVIVVVAIIGAFYLLPALNPGMRHAPRIQCVNNLKQCALATRVWEGDHNDKYPPQVGTTNGGSMEFITGANAWRTFQVMSNELSTPKVVVCPGDSNRSCATNFTAFHNSNISFFVGVDAGETNPAGFLYGDRNITSGTPIKDGLLTLTTNQLSGWTADIHRKVGNIALADAGVQQLSVAGLHAAVLNTDMESNRLLMPILGP